MGEWPLDSEDFSAYYEFAPAALALRESIRLQAVRKQPLLEPILDVGCGDGLFARLAFPNTQIWGIDISPMEVRRAQATSSYSTLVCGNISQVNLPSNFFNGAIANCSLEHVPEVDIALANIHSALAPGARFLNIVPKPDWARKLATPTVLEKLGLVGLSNAYSKGLDRVFKHLHLYDSTVWTGKLEAAGFRVLMVEELVGKRSAWLFDLLLAPSLFGLLSKTFTGRWVNLPGLRPFTADTVRHVLNASATVLPPGAPCGEYLFICQKEAEGEQ